MDTPTWDSTQPVPEAAEATTPMRGPAGHGEHGAEQPHELVPDTEHQVPYALSANQDLQAQAKAAMPTWENTLTPEEMYGTPSQQAIAGLEGAGKGVIGPLAPLFEKAAGVKPEHIRGREEVNPWTSGIGETAGLIAPLLISGGSSAGARAALEAGEGAHEIAAGTGLLSNLAKYGTVSGLADVASEAAMKGTGFGKILKAEELTQELTHAGMAAKTAEAVAEHAVGGISFGAKVGSNAVRQAAAAAAFQMSDEAAKIVTQDENAPISMETAMAHVGAAGALGGTAGALFTGAVSPLYHATIGNKVEEMLQASKYHMDAAGQKLKNFSGVTPAEVDTIPKGLIANPGIRSVADEYAAAHGIKLNHDLPFIKADPDRAKAIADAYEKMVHAPNDPHVRKAYNALAQETLDQWEAIKKTGLKVSAIQPGMENPYKNSQAMIDDVRNNNHMWFYPTSQGFGSGDTLPKSFSMISSQIGDKANPEMHEALRQDLLKAGFQVTEGAGKYGGNMEPSFMVEHGTSPAELATLNALGKKYGQESIIHSSSAPGTRLNTLEYMDGRPAEHGFGVELNPHATDNFTQNDKYGKFGLQFKKEVPNQAHPLLTYSNEMIDGKPAQVNDIFRIVHDYFGHAKEGFSFGPNGEENAWRHHMQMFSPDAQRALTSETRGQNSWVNFGPKGEANRANPAMTEYAEQKAGLLPKWTINTDYKPVTAVRLPVKGAKDALATGKDFAMEAGVDASYESLKDEHSRLNQAARALGIDIAPVMKAAMNGEPKAVQIFNELRESQHPEILAGLKDLPAKIDESVAQHLGTDLESAAHYSNHTAGSDLHESFLKEYNSHYAPVEEAANKRNADAAGIMVPDEARRDFGGRIIERGMNEAGTDSPYYKIYSDYAQRVMAKDDIAGLDKLKSELFNRAKSMSTDINEKNAFRNVRSMINDFQEEQMNREGVLIGNEGTMSASEILAKRTAFNKQYTEFSNMSNELSDHVGLGDFRGAGTLKAKMADISPEDLLKKFSPKGNADSIPFLQKYFPETAAKLQQIEAKKFLSGAVKQEAGETTLDMRKLSNAIDKLNKGAPEYANYVVPKEAQDQIKHAQVLMDAIPKIKSSGTAGWMTKMMAHVPASALSMVGFMTGHNPVSSYILGELAQRLGRDVPDAMKLSYLKYLGSSNKVNAQGFHAMFDMADSAMKGHKALLQATGNVFKPVSRVLVSNQMPNAAEREKLDKAVTKFADNPAAMQKIADNSLGHYLPEHGKAYAQTAGAQVQYLNSLKPRPTQNGPLDTPTPPSKLENARYERALDIANNPLILMQDVKDGTISANDVVDLNSMYPNYYKNMVHQLTNTLAEKVHDEEPIPYVTRMGMSIFMAQPLDSTMQPMSISAAQGVFTKKPAAPQQGGPNPKSKGAPGKLGRDNASYRTPAQSAESDRSSRD